MHILRRTCGLLVAIAAGCASTAPSLHAELQRTEATLAPPPSSDAPPSPSRADFDGSLNGYVAYAYAHSPALRASFEMWRAATYRPDQARALPEPTLTYAVFVRSVETRVGPQRHRFGASQWFPWPTQLTAGRDAAALEAQAAQREFEAHALRIEADVAGPYWSLWRLARQDEVLEAEVEILGSLSEQIRVRVEVGMAELSDLAQLDLLLSRTKDQRAGLTERQRIAQARLVRVLGAPDDTETPVAPREVLVAEVSESVAELSAAAGQHPHVQALAVLSEAAGERVRAARAQRAPSFGVGVDWILTGAAPANPAPADSGKDAVALSLSMKVPLWSRAYKAKENEARAHGAAMRSRALDARNSIAASVREHAARLRDDVRRVRVCESTLIPQAQAAFDSVLASYSSGRATVAELLGAQRELLALRDHRFAAQADYGTHLAQLQSMVGRPVTLTDSLGGNDDR